MGKKNPGSSDDTEKHSIEGHTVEIRRTQDKEELWIDGIRRKFFLSKGGYNLHEAAYEPPQKSLRDVAEHFLRKYPQQADRDRGR